MSHAPSPLSVAQRVPPAAGTSLPTWCALGLIALVTVAAYWPALHGEMVWDDNAHITKPELWSAEGLYRIWFEPGATQQYYPLLHSLFWVEHRLWGEQMLGYHIANLLLHIMAAGLVYAVVRKLQIPGALLAAAVFALHPVQVESVAWVTEQKNTLSAVFYLSAMLAYLQFDESRRPAWYGFALALFILGLLSKTVVATLPAALLVIFWWSRSRDPEVLEGRRPALSWGRDVLPLVPWFVLGAVAGLCTAQVERVQIGAEGAEFNLSLIERGLLAGRVIWFYAGTLLYPAKLMFIYPRWSVDATQPWQWLFPVGVLAVLVACWLVRKQTRAPLAAALFFIGTLFPVLGFFNVYPFKFSYVADHFQYLASLGIVVPVAAGLTLALRRLAPAHPNLAPLIGAAMVAVLAILSWRQGDLYAHDLIYFWRATIAQNPTAPMPRINLATTLLAKGGSPEDAIRQLEEALRLDPTFPDAYNNLGVALQRAGRTREAMPYFQKAVELRPGYPHALNNLGAALVDTDRPQEAILLLEPYVHANQAVDPDLSSTLGAALLNADRPQEAIPCLEQALRLKPGLALAHSNLGKALVKVSRADEAFAHFQEAFRINPGVAEPHADFGLALARSGRPQDAIPYLEAAVRLNPAEAETHSNLGSALSEVGRLGEALASLQQAVQLRPDYADAWFNLAAVHARLNRRDEAVAATRRALELARAQGRADLVGQLEANLSGLGGEQPPAQSPGLPP